MSNRKRGFFEKIRFKYKIYVIDENTLEEKFNLRLSRLSFFWYLSLLGFISFLLFSVLILFTPLKQLVIDYGDLSVRSDLISEAIRVDSIQQQTNLQEANLTLLRNAIVDKVDLDSISTKDSLVVTDWHTLKLDPSKEELAFRKQYEENEKYNLGQVESTDDNNRFVFYKPSSQGVVTHHFGKGSLKNGITIAASPQSAVSSVLDGTVINTEATILSGNNITVQHLNGFVSIYKNTGKLLKQIGDHVKAGEAIALFGSNEDNGDSAELDFELWQNGTPVNPEEFIDF